MSGYESASTEASSRRLKLVLKTSPLSTPVDAQRVDGTNAKDGSSSPPRPSFSPVTPTLSHEKLALQDDSKQEEPARKEEPQWIDEPPPLPLSLDENSDAIALRATISLLQMQRQQSLKDIRDLDKMRDAALEDPRGFADELRAGKLKKAMPGEIVFDDVEYEDSEGETEPHDEQKMPKFGYLPNAQNIARCPPVEWSKYHVLGKPLEELHLSQTQQSGVSSADFAAGKREITAAYRPFKDKLDAQK